MPGREERFPAASTARTPTQYQVAQRSPESVVLVAAVVPTYVLER
jgi:hypothetical protein